MHKPTSRLFILCRHAESAANASGVIDSDPYGDVRLSQRGEEQAHALGVQFAVLDVSLAVTSRFRRTRETARLALDGRIVPLVTEAAFDEIDAGTLNGGSIEEYWSWRESHDEDERLPGGENVDDVLRRHAVGLRRLLTRNEPVTLVVLHEVGLRHVARASAGWALEMTLSNRLSPTSSTWMGSLAHARRWKPARSLRLLRGSDRRSGAGEAATGTG